MTYNPAATLRSLVEHGVVFVLVGGQAARVLGSPTATVDVDVCHATDVANLDRLATALRALGAHLRRGDDDVPFQLDARSLRDVATLTLTTVYGPLDLLALPTGTSGYADLAAGARPVALGDVAVPVVALDDLIRMKRAAGRPKDRIEVEVLLALRDELDARD